MDRIPGPGEFYRHFKNRMYQVLHIASHTETGEKLVIYQALYGDFGIYARPLEQFMSPVDREKYPDAKQKDRFERIILGKDEPDRPEGDMQEEEPSMSPLLMEFLDKESYEERLAVLRRMKGKVGQREVDSLCMVLDFTSRTGTVEEQLESLIQYLKMQQRYDASRLRRR